MKQVIYYNTPILASADENWGRLYKHENGWYCVDDYLYISDIVGWMADRRNVWGVLTLGSPDWEATFNIHADGLYSLEAIDGDGHRYVYSHVFYDENDNTDYPNDIFGGCTAWKDPSYIADAIWRHDEYYRGSEWTFIITSANNDVVLEIHCDYKP